MIIDARAGSCELLLIKPLDELAIGGYLDSGDVSIAGNGPNESVLAVGVEVKSIWDFLASMESGRLSGAEGQLSRMAKDYDERWILTHGHYRSGPFNRLEVQRGGRWRTHRMGSRDVPFGYVEGAFLTYTAAGFHHKHVSDEEQAAAWLACLERWWSKDWEEHKAFHKINRANQQASAASLIPDITPDELQRMRVAADLPGIGWERALAAATYFNSVRSMINASEEEWSKVQGIGKVLAKAIVRAVS